MATFFFFFFFLSGNESMLVEQSVSSVLKPELFLHFCSYKTVGQSVVNSRFRKYAKLGSRSLLFSIGNFSSNFLASFHSFAFWSQGAANILCIANKLPYLLA